MSGTQQVFHKGGQLSLLLLLHSRSLSRGGDPKKGERDPSAGVIIKLVWRLGPRVPWVTHRAQETQPQCKKKKANPFSCVTLGT